nr:RNA 2'-phosphotransferase [Marinicella sp. W31]MDC2878268.1 RNA 2'-phosphotransferase [Marinicella sp. W31]
MSSDSKFISRVLRHEPELVGLKLRAGGWALVSDLLRGLKKAGRPLNVEELRQLVADNDKQRFTLSENGEMIRAAQGHSIAVDLGLSLSVPPPVLFHGTARANLDAIFADGIKPGRRQYVHLSQDATTAEKVGQRHGKPVVLSIDALRMHEDRCSFWVADNGVWLTEWVAPEYLGFQ